MSALGASHCRSLAFNSSLGLLRRHAFLRIVLFLAVLSAASGAAARPRGTDGNPLEWVPNELLVALTPDAASRLVRQLAEGRSADAIQLPDSSSQLLRKWRIRKIAPVFRDFGNAGRGFGTSKARPGDPSVTAERRAFGTKASEMRNVRAPELDRFYRIELAETVSLEVAIEQFRNHPSVVFAEPNYYYFADAEPNDPHFAVQWALHNIGQSYPTSGGGTETGWPDRDVDAPLAWDAFAATDPVIIAIIDSGVDYTHADLAQQMWTDSNGYVGYDFVGSDNYPQDELGHGTHVAGIVGAQFDNGIGISGLCPNARIMAVRLLDENGVGTAEMGAQAIQYAVDNGATVINASWGSNWPSEILKAAIDYAQSQGVIVVASAGNENWTVDHYPATYENVIAVASTDSDDVKASLSNYGSWVDISAPGQEILSLRGVGTNLCSDDDCVYDTEYLVASGTSMACPHVTAVAGLIVSQYPDLSIDQVRARLLGTADSLAGENPRHPGVNRPLSHLLGAGRVNAHRAIIDNEHPAIVLSGFETSNDQTGETVPVPGEITSLRVTLRNVWADALDVRAVLSSSNPSVIVHDGVSDFGPILLHTESTNSLDPFALEFLDAITAEDPIVFQLDITSAGGYTRSLDFTFAEEVRLQQGDWPKEFGQFVEPVPYDYDGDGKVELLVRYQNPMRVVVHEPDGSIDAELKWNRNFLAEIAVGDLEKDGIVETVALFGTLNHFDWHLCIWKGKSEQPVQAIALDHKYSFSRSPTLYDLDGDGNLEIIIGGVTVDGGHPVITVFTSDDGTMRERWEEVYDADDLMRLTDIAIGDIDANSPARDVNPEIIFGTATTSSGDGGKLFALHSDGRVKIGWPVSLQRGLGRAPVLADLTGDGNLEIVVNLPLDAGLQAHKHTGDLLWTVAGNGKISIVADLDGDGDPEVLIQNRAFHHNGTNTGWRYSGINTQGVSVGDIDGDGDMELFLGSSRSVGVLGYHFSGTPVAGFPLYVDPRDRLALMTPVLADLDHDGDIEIIIAGSFLNVWDLSGTYDPARIECAMYQYNPHRTGNYEDRLNLPPVWFVPPTSRVFVRAVDNTLYVKATDPEGKSVSYDLVGLPTGATFEQDGDGMRLRWRPGPHDLSQTIRYRVTDVDGEQIERPIEIEVVDPPTDLDGDGDTDLRDVAALLNCWLVDLKGPHSGCGILDFNHDGKIDLGDFPAIPFSLTGPR